MGISKWLSYSLSIPLITSIRKITLTNKLWKNAKNELSYAIYKNIYVTVHYIVYGVGATRSSVPLLQYCRISWNKYLFLSSLKPSGLIRLGRMVCCGKFEGSFSNMKDCSAEKLFSLKKTFPGSSLEKRKWWYFLMFGIFLKYCPRSNVQS